MLKDCGPFLPLFTFIFLYHSFLKCRHLCVCLRRQINWNFNTRKTHGEIKRTLSSTRTAGQTPPFLSSSNETHSFVSPKLSISTQICKGSTAKCSYVILLLTHNILRKEISKDILNMFQMLFDPYAELCFSFSSSLLPQLSSKQFFCC